MVAPRRVMRRPSDYQQDFESNSTKNEVFNLDRIFVHTKQNVDASEGEDTGGIRKAVSGIEDAASLMLCSWNLTRSSIGLIIGAIAEEVAYIPEVVNLIDNRKIRARRK